MKKADALLAAAVSVYPENSYHNSESCYVQYRTFTAAELGLMQASYKMRVKRNRGGSIRVTVTRKEPIGIFEI